MVLLQEATVFALTSNDDLRAYGQPDHGPEGIETLKNEDDTVIDVRLRLAAQTISQVGAFLYLDRNHRA